MPAHGSHNPRSAQIAGPDPRTQPTTTGTARVAGRPVAHRAGSGSPPSSRRQLHHAPSRQHPSHADPSRARPRPRPRQVAGRQTATSGGATGGAAGDRPVPGRQRVPPPSRWSPNRAPDPRHTGCSTCQPSTNPATGAPPCRPRPAPRSLPPTSGIKNRPTSHTCTHYVFRIVRSARRLCDGCARPPGYPAHLLRAAEPARPMTSSFARRDGDLVWRVHRPGVAGRIQLSRGPATLACHAWVRAATPTRRLPAAVPDRRAWQRCCRGRHRAGKGLPEPAPHQGPCPHGLRGDAPPLNGPLP